MIPARKVKSDAGCRTHGRGEKERRKKEGRWFNSGLMFVALRRA